MKKIVVSNIINKDNPTQKFSYDPCEVFKYIFFIEHLQTTGSIKGIIGMKWINKLLDLCSTL